MPIHSGLSAVAKTKLFWCRRFHRKWRRRVGLLLAANSTRIYQVRCLNCDVCDTEIDAHLLP
jgi:hypothetical protein